MVCSQTMTILHSVIAPAEGFQATRAKRLHLRALRAWWAAFKCRPWSILAKVLHDMPTWDVERPRQHCLHCSALWSMVKSLEFVVFGHGVIVSE